MSVTQSPVGLAAAPVANQVSQMVTFKERLCRPYCVDSTVQPQATVEYSLGVAKLVGTTVFVPVTATVSIVVPGCNGSAARTHIYTETFDVAFQGRTALPASVSLTSLGRTFGPAAVKCGCAYAYKINDSIVVDAPAA